MEILVLDRTWRRVAAEIERIAPGLKPVLVHDDGSLSFEGRKIARDDACFEIAWASRDLFLDLEGRAVREFMVAALKSETVRWLQSGGAGYDHPVFAMISKKGVRLTVNDAGSVAIAEYVLSSVLDYYQPNPKRRSAQDEKRWARYEFRELAGGTWLVIGLGAIGREVAIRAAAFGAHVIGVRRNPSGDEPVAEMLRPQEIARALPRADVVTLCASANRSTEHLVDADFLAVMKQGSVLVNIARGTLIDESALLAGLEHGVPECAILDVFETEPLPDASPLWSHPRVRVTAHCAAGGSGTGDRSDRVFLANLERYVAGAPLAMELDPSLLEDAR